MNNTLKYLKFFTALILTGFFSSLSLASNKQFICSYKSIIDYMNSNTLSDKRFLESRLTYLKNQTIKQKDLEDLTAILMQYRLIPMNENRPSSSCRYYSYICFKERPSITHYALKYLEERPYGPRFCDIKINQHIKSESLFAAACQEAIRERIQTIPFPLAIAQAALESSWGRSRFSQGNFNYFGLQTRFNSPQKVLNNAQCTSAKQNSKNCVYHFNTVDDGAFVYSQTLNTRPVYKKLREIRSQNQDLLDQDPCRLALKMAEGLESYAEDLNYINKVKSIIKKVCRIVNNC